MFVATVFVEIASRSIFSFFLFLLLLNFFTPPFCCPFIDNKRFQQPQQQQTNPGQSGSDPHVQMDQSGARNGGAAASNSRNGVVLNISQSSDFESKYQ